MSATKKREATGAGVPRPTDREPPQRAQCESPQPGDHEPPQRADGMSPPLPEPLPGPVLEALRALGLVDAGDAPRCTPLTGGVSSDILLVTTATRSFCIKRALAQLKVAAQWEAPIERNGAEAAWIRIVGNWLPDLVPRLLGEVPALGFFAMSWLPPVDHPVWKAQLASGIVDTNFAAAVGSSLAEIHRRSAGSPTLAAAFANDATFESIRIDPYLRATARRHPDLAGRFDAIAATTLATRRALVHGDVSPKNILCGPRGPVLLDAECAWYGDPAFDLAFCLNHLLLKAAWRPQWQARYRDAFVRLAQAYFARVDWEAVESLEQRCAALLPALALARIDGKSPVEYLTDDESRPAVRELARELIVAAPDRLESIATRWFARFAAE